ncbi:hypothetical protein, partial [Terrisporobacter mayombei]
MNMKNMSAKNMENNESNMSHMGNLKVKFWVSVVLAIPVLLLAPIMGLNVSILSFSSPLIVG